MTDETGKTDGEDRIEGSVKETKDQDTRKCFFVNFAESVSWLEDLCFIGMIPRCVLLYGEKFTLLQLQTMNKLTGQACQLSLPADVT